MKLLWLVTVLLSHGHLMKLADVEYAKGGSKGWNFIIWRAQKWNNHDVNYSFLLSYFIQVQLGVTLQQRWDAVSHSILTSFCQVSVCQWTLVACPWSDTSYLLPELPNSCWGTETLSYKRGQANATHDFCGCACFPYIYKLMVETVIKNIMSWCCRIFRENVL